MTKIFRKLRQLFEKGLSQEDNVRFWKRFFSEERNLVRIKEYMQARKACLKMLGMLEDYLKDERSKSVMDVQKIKALMKQISFYNQRVGEIERQITYILAKEEDDDIIENLSRR